jgi:hypothetical protein
MYPSPKNTRKDGLDKKSGYRFESGYDTLHLKKECTSMENYRKDKSEYLL